MRFSKRDGESYLRIDNRLSGGQLLEANTFKCAHCPRITILNPERRRARNHCRKCDRYICDSPECNFECVPMKRTMDEQQEALERGIIRPLPPHLISLFEGGR